jgi:hypothetical protein
VVSRALVEVMAAKIAAQKQAAAVARWSDAGPSDYVLDKTKSPAEKKQEARNEAVAIRVAHGGAPLASASPRQPSPRRTPCGLDCCVLAGITRHVVSHGSRPFQS